jgi:amino acid transporter
VTTNEVTTATEAPAIDISEDNYVRGFGIEPKLDRVLGAATSGLLGIACSGPTVGILSLGGLIIASAGPAGVWGVAAILILQSLCALLWAELSSVYPLSGGIYQWGRRIGGDTIGWFVAVFYLGAEILALGVMGVIINGLLNGIFPSLAVSKINSDIIHIIVVSLAALIISLRLRVTAIVNAIGVVAELTVLVVGGVLLLTHAHHSPGLVFHSHLPGSAGHWWLALFPLSIVWALAAMTGWEVAGTFAEETHGARQNSPRAIIFACVVTIIPFMFFLFCLVIASRGTGVSAANAVTYAPRIIESALGSVMGKIVLLSACVAAFSTLLAGFASNVRILYGTARDHATPFPRVLDRVSKRTQEPLMCVVVIYVMLVLTQFIPSIEILVAAVAAFFVTAYLLVFVSALVKRLQGWPEGQVARFSLGRWGLPLNIYGIVFMLWMGIETYWPGHSGVNPDLLHVPVMELLAGIFLIAGGAWWLLGGKLRADAQAAAEANAGADAGAVGS